MSVLIRGMEMPRSCEECDFIDDVEGMCLALYATTRKNIPKWGFVPNCLKNERQAWCPLIEIPPHGRLIDADALTELVETEFRNWGEDYDASQFLGDIEDAPTVIEAEGRE